MKTLFCPIRLVLSYILLLSFIGCSNSTDKLPYNSRAIDSIMDQAELAMDDKPEVADSLMRLIVPEFIHGKKRHARYSLMFTGAELRNHMYIANDSLILNAALYYSASKNTKYHFLSYYYLGCVYTELGRYVDAAIALAQAEQLADKIDNDYWKGLLYSQTGKLFRISHERNRAIEYFKKARACYENAGKEVHSMRAHNDIEGCKTEIVDSESQDSVMCQIQDWAKHYNFADLFKIKDIAKRSILYCIILVLLVISVIQIVYVSKKKKMYNALANAQILIRELNESNNNRAIQLMEKRKQIHTQIREHHDMSNHLFNLFFDSENEVKITKQRLITIINSIKRSYTSQENTKKLDQLLNDNYDNIMEQVSSPELKLSSKELQIIRLSISGLSALAIAMIVEDSPQNVYKIRSRLKKKLAKHSTELEDLLNKSYKSELDDSSSTSK